MGLFSKAPDTKELERLRQAWSLIEGAIKKAEAEHCCSKFATVAEAIEAGQRLLLNGKGRAAQTNGTAG